MTAPNEAVLEVSFPKALIFSAVSMTCFFAGLIFIGMPMHDPLLIGTIVVVVAGMTFIFAMCFCFIFRCKISREGLCSAAPTFYQTILRWGDIVAVRTTLRGSPFYLIRGSRLGEFCVLPRRFLLKNPESLNELIERYAPADNIVRKELVN
ncbi:MAG TPA: hypothetical protein VHC44_11050 [Verrucomicrobiae bacterium]|nr:hypothetical protein [Verrucomicrobiae bacterium]